jgi:hypothetical protein
MTTNKIQQLASQARDQMWNELEQSVPAAWYGDKCPSQEAVDERFAELLIQECYAWVKYNGGLSSEFDLQDLKAHLGIKP